MLEFNELSPLAKKLRFQQDHGPECYRDGRTSAFYYADGAMMEDAGDLTLVLYVFPPQPSDAESEYLLYWRRLKFAQLKLARAVTEFDELNGQLAVTLPDDPHASLAQLSRLKNRVEQQKVLVAQADTALAQTKRGRRLTAQRIQDQEQQQRMVDFQSERSKVRI